jgi:DNA-binding GntR family transcriptional regulator
MNAMIKQIANQIKNAIIQGAHTTHMIIINQGLELRYNEVCEALAWLESEGLVEYHNRNLAHEYGWFITDKGWSKI